ncbi:MAG: LbetaH domain-containing protein [Planctomycetota bacterium]|jgi:carbonic anhydrase/acetyltransferase-like protein (isoleucine patch superfamily)
MTSDSSMSLRSNPQGDRPQVDPSAYIDPTAQLIGNVRIGTRVYVGPNAVIRADETDDSLTVAPIEIGPECNVQDGVIIHALGGTRVTVGRRSSLAHGCIVHGPCVLGEGCFVGFGAKVFEATVANGVFVGTGAIVQAVELAPKSFVPAGVSVLCREHVVKLVSTTSAEHFGFMEKVVAANVALAQGYIRLEQDGAARVSKDQRPLQNVLNANVRKEGVAHGKIQ